MRGFCCFGTLSVSTIQTFFRPLPIIYLARALHLYRNLTVCFERPGYV